MFNLKSDNDRDPFNAAQDSNDEEATSQRDATSPFAPAVTAASCVSVFASDLTIVGDRITIISQSKLRVEGQIRGSVHAREVVISKEGSVTGEVWAERIDVLGEVLERGASYERQRAVVATGGGLTDVVDALVTEFAEDRFVRPGEVANAE